MTTTLESTVKIVVLQRGWVVVGKVTQDGRYLTIDSAAVIRRWGTTKGLGQIAVDGPTSTTVLDTSPVIRCHELTVVFTIDCNDKAWLPKL